MGPELDFSTLNSSQWAQNRISVLSILAQKGTEVRRKLDYNNTILRAEYAIFSEGLLKYVRM